MLRARRKRGSKRRSSKPGNLKTAKTLGLRLPLLGRADEVIE